MNIFVGTGRLVKDNELRRTNNGKEVLQNTIAIRRDYKNDEGNYDSDFVNVIFFGVTAKYINDYAPKGSLIEIRGKWRHRRYQDNQGNTRYVDECVVEAASVLIANKQDNQSTMDQVNDDNEFVDPFADDMDDIYNDNPFM